MLPRVTIDRDIRARASISGPVDAKRLEHLPLVGEKCHVFRGKRLRRETEVGADHRRTSGRRRAHLFGEAKQCGRADDEAANPNS